MYMETMSLVVGFLSRLAGIIKNKTTCFHYYAPFHVSPLEMYKRSLRVQVTRTFSYIGSSVSINKWIFGIHEDKNLMNLPLCTKNRLFLIIFSIFNDPQMATVTNF